MKKKIVLLGAGSALFTRGLLGNLTLEKEFGDCTVVLMDINPDMLALMERYARKLVRDSHSGLRVEATTELDRALEGADFVVCTIAAQDSQARGIEIEIPLQYGYHHSWGDTTGPAGVFRALRHIPIFLDIARRIERICPEAWLLNFTNPMAALCRAVSLETGVKVLGFCDAPPYYRRFIEKEVFGFPEGSLETLMAGVDHLVWFLEMRHAGKNVYPLFRQRVESLRDRYPATVELFEAYGYYLSPGDEHNSEFFPYLLRDSRSMRQFGLKEMDVAWHRERRVSLLAQLEREVASPEPLRPAPLPPEEEVTKIIRSIAQDERREFVASLPNRDVITNLPDYAIVEAPIRLGATVQQLTPISLPAELTPPLVSSLVKDELVVAAALTGDRERVFQAVLACPLTASIGQARDITNAMLEALADFLPTRFK